MQGSGGEGPSTLTRRTAVRDPSAKGLLERRSQSRNNSRDQIDLSGISQTTNPWAEAMGKARSRKSSTDLENEERTPRRIEPANGSQGVRNAAEISQTPPSSANEFKSRENVQNHSSMPNRVLPTPPLSQKAPQSANSVFPLQNMTDFMLEATRRHEAFLKRENEATTDLERLQLFVDFVQEESLVRKEAYSVAFNGENFNREEARARLFSGTSRRRASARDETTIANGHAESPENASGSSQARPETMWWRDYKPVLSPIASMAYDEESSRGRAPSRWWESQTGSNSDGRAPRVQRTKRESKYMSLSKELLQDAESSADVPPLPNFASSDYPEEKTNPATFGFYEEPNSSRTVQRSKKIDSPLLLDVSRFITLPPPYPRHYPAVNNNHPDLAEYRTTVRTLSDLNDVQDRKSRQKLSVQALRADRQAKLEETRKQVRANIRTQIDDGSITYAEAAEAEAALLQEEHEMERKGLKSEFDTLQDVVINPLHDHLNDRVVQLSDHIQRLQKDLFIDAENQDPDQPVQEGDDYPELLEKLTQLKWLFETREQIHKELFDLLSERNDAYRDIVVLPYKQANNTEKVRGTEEFFRRDAATRAADFNSQALQRHDEFLRTIEDNAQRGVELQSSAFWDIAPGLLDLLEKIPEEVRHLDIHIPESEYKENPSYHQYPQQYLFTLLMHAEKSTYQFIESQINMHCLVHEIKSSHLTTRYRVLQAQQRSPTGSRSEIDSRKETDEAALTAELKNRASMIEEQWLDALGSKLHGTRERVKQALLEEGGWDDMMEEINE